MSGLAPLGIADEYAEFRRASFAREAGPELLAALESMMPKGICLTNRNVPDNTVVPIEATVTMGRLRELSALIARANGQ